MNLALIIFSSKFNSYISHKSFYDERLQWKISGLVQTGSRANSIVWNIDEQQLPGWRKYINCNVSIHLLKKKIQIISTLMKNDSRRDKKLKIWILSYHLSKFWKVIVFTLYSSLTVIINFFFKFYLGLWSHCGSTPLTWEIIDLPKK